MLAARRGFEPRRRRRREFVALLFIRLTGVLVAAVMASVLGFLLWNGAGAVTVTFLTEFPRDGMTAGGILPAIEGTLILALGALLTAIPLGFGAAVYLAEYARPGHLVSVIRMGVLNLSGVPSVVFGLFGLALFVKAFGFGRSILAGSLTLGLLILPTVVAASEEALRQTPQSFREAALALGASRWQAIRQVVLPAALPGMLTGAILALGRAAGETAPIVFTASCAYTLSSPGSVFQEVMALSTHILNLATNGTHIEETRPQQFGTALVLLAMVLGLSLCAIVVRAKLRKGRRW
ncbi:MAG: phosphate ABC transporter permease PstA [Deltaproteobacteria bacterium]|jgi:phosphate transport system permease protein|nr:phosphate ABC transporter permease PstA [Deltaproteobacteria bacterium]